MLSLFKKYALLIGTLSCFLFLFITADLGKALQAVFELPLHKVVLAGAALTIGLLVSGFRCRLVLRGLGIPISLRLAMHANLLGIIGSLLFFSVIGQTLARTSVLSRHGISGPSVLVANAYERLSALLSLGVLTLLGALYLFGGVSFDLAVGGARLLKFLLALTTVGVVMLLGLDRRLLRCLWKGMTTRAQARAFTVGLALSLLMHGSTLAAFVLLGNTIQPEVPVLELTAASLIVMFAAALPISFGGWGVRELSAVQALGQIGFTTPHALTVSISVGVLSLIGLGLLVFFDLSSPVTQSISSASRAIPKAEKRSLDIARMTAWIIPLLTAALIPFQIFVPTAGSWLNVNLADPVAISGGFLFLVRYNSLRDQTKIWRLPFAEIWILIWIIAIAFSFFNGVARFGITDWALYNRIIGFFVVLSYAATGALVVAAAGKVGLRTLLEVFVLSCAAIAALDIVLAYSWKIGLLNSRNIVNPLQLNGVARNPNAFALQVSLALSALIALGHVGQGKVWSSLQIPIFSTLLIALVWASSRSGLICGVAVLGTALWLGVLKLRAVIKMLLGVVLFFAFVVASQNLMSSFEGASAIPTNRALSPLPRYKSFESDSNRERWYSIERGIEMWRSAPVLGAGLGAFVNQMKVEIGKPLVIHNTFVWLLAELGIVGTLIFVFPFALVFVNAWHERKTNSVATITLFLSLLVFSISQLVHDVFFQRIFWLLFGATIFTGRFRTWRQKNEPTP